MSKRILFFICVFVFSVCHCAFSQSADSPQRAWFTIDLEQGQSLRYKLISERDTKLDWGKSKRKRSKKPMHSKETLEAVMVYEPVEVDAYGVSTIRATCESVVAKRGKSRRKGKDPARFMEGKSFTFTVSPGGEIVDGSDFVRVLKEVGDKAFTVKNKRRIKDPDMLTDFVVLQWFLWDSIRSVENPIEGVKVGDAWESKLLSPTPMLLRKTRNVDYVLREIVDEDTDAIAVIESTFSDGGKPVRGWPSPWSGRFQMRGEFGFLFTFLKGFDLVRLEGEGQERFNLSKGRSEGYVHEYEMELESKGSLFPNVEPKALIKQKYAMERLD